MKNFLDRASDYKSSANNFKFYVSAQDFQDINKSAEDAAFEKPKPKLIDGEIIIAEGNRVLYFPNVANRTKGLLGNLYVTNFRFLFDAYEDDNSNNEGVIVHQINRLVGDHSSCLTNIQSLYQLCGEKKKKLFQDSQLTEKIKALQIICKNLKVFTFNFDQSPITQGKNVAKTLLHHAFPGRHQLLFAYDFRSKVIGTGKFSAGVVSFSKKNEWENELMRTCSMSASYWRVSTQNHKFQLSTSLPRWVIVPHSVLDYDFATASHSFRCNRPPIWTWSSPNGAALIRTADLLPTITDRTQENRMLENIRKCHPLLKGPCIKDLDKDLPSVTDLSQSYAKLRDLCIPDSHRQFKLQDSHLYSALENTKWLQYVSSCLKVVVEAAQAIRDGSTVVLQELDGRDTSAVISSLVQLVLDSHARSLIGFQSLIQKEWVALGHPFCRRLGHLKANSSEQSPVFLLFLDCVWQLQNQFPSSFEFTETYLTTLWDSVHVSVFDTFLFDCEKDRADAATSSNEKLELRSVWDWNAQFSDSDIELFFNPLYKFCQLCDSPALNNQNESSKMESTILPEYSLPYLGIWTQCYFRWLPLLSIPFGGQPQIYIVHRQLLMDIQSLLNDIRGNSKKTKTGNSLYDTMTNVNRGINNNNNNNNNNNSNNNKNNHSESNSNYTNNKKDNFIDGRVSSCSRGFMDCSEENYDLSVVASTELSNKSIMCKDNWVLFKKRDIIDNFFPFTINSTSCVSNVFNNSSNLTEFEMPSLYNFSE